MISDTTGDFIAHAVITHCQEYTLYKAIRQIDSLPVFLKVERKLHHPSSIQHEWSILQEMNAHHMTSPLGVVDYGKGQALVMRNSHGVENLRVRLRRGAMDSEEFLPVAIELVSALRSIHENNIIHHSLTPEHILIGTENPTLVSIIHFANARRLDTMQEKMTPPFYWQSDLYALGMILYQMLTGLSPFSAAHAPANSNQQHYDGQTVQIRTLYEGIPALSHIIMKLIAPTIEERYQRSDEVLSDLVNYCIEQRSITTSAKTRTKGNVIDPEFTLE